MPSDEAMAIAWYVRGLKNQDGWVQSSSFRALLRDARAATGRDLDTGEVLPEREGHSRSWLGALAYLVLLDQLGGALRTHDAVEVPREGSFFTALRLFAPEVGERDRYALYALRCSLAHHYTLFNDNRDPRLQHRFNLNPEPSAILVLVPPDDRRWDGQMTEASRGGPTIVGLRALGDLLERIVHRLEGARPDELRIAPEAGNPQNFTLRHSFQYWDA
jgi:hypothetical protein